MSRIALSALLLAGCVDTLGPPVDGSVDADRTDAGQADASSDGAIDAADTPDAAADSTTPDAGPVPEGPPLYVPGPLHSPITPRISTRIRDAVAADRNPQVFAKVGDSITVSRNFLHCFGGTRYDLAGRPLEATRAHYAAGDAAGSDPFQRASGAATVGWHAGRAIAGSPSPLASELNALSPSLALVMFGTNDIGITGLDRYAENLYDVVDQILEAGTLPILSTIPSRVDSASADADVPRFNLVARAIAQTREVPLIDLHRALMPLPNRGLGGDDLHPSASPSGACDLNEEGLRYGYNMRNLLTLEALDRVRQALEGSSLDPAGPTIAGAGTHADPIEVALPFVHGADTSRSPERRFDRYPACGADQNESGPEWVYEVVLSDPSTLRARVFDRGDVDVDIHLLSALDTSACIARDNLEVREALPVGTYFVVVDSWVGSSGERSGEYLLTIDTN